MQFTDFFALYDRVHYPLVTTICMFGIVSHFVNVLVLTRDKVFNATNLLLVSLSCSQFLLLVSFLFYSYNMLYAERRCSEQLWSRGWVLSLLLSVNLNVVIHTTAVFHVIALSVIRYVTISFYARRPGYTWFTLRRASHCCLLIVVLVTLLCTPVFVGSTVSRSAGRPWCFDGATPNVSFQIYQIAFRFGPDSALTKFNFWFTGVACKLLPCIILFAMSVLLALRLRAIRHRSKRVRRPGAQSRRYNRTTHLILMVMVLFIAVELPQAFLNLLAGILDRSFMITYSKMADFFEMLTVLYSSVNFAIFCMMNGQFRATLAGYLACSNGCERRAISRRDTFRSSAQSVTRTANNDDGAAPTPPQNGAVQRARHLTIGSERSLFLVSCKTSRDSARLPLDAPLRNNKQRLSVTSSTASVFLRKESALSRGTASSVGRYRDRASLRSQSVGIKAVSDYDLQQQQASPPDEAQYPMFYKETVVPLS